jgi:DNA polymerase III epsilon subunit-like protein
VLETSVLVIDFETTGLCPEAGNRITEVAALLELPRRILRRGRQIAARRDPG